MKIRLLILLVALLTSTALVYAQGGYRDYQAIWRYKRLDKIRAVWGEIRESDNWVLAGPQSGISHFVGILREPEPENGLTQQWIRWGFVHDGILGGRRIANWKKGNGTVYGRLLSFPSPEVPPYRYGIYMSGDFHVLVNGYIIATDPILTSFGFGDRAYAGSDYYVGLEDPDWVTFTNMSYEAGANATPFCWPTQGNNQAQVINPPYTIFPLYYEPANCKDDFRGERN